MFAYCERREGIKPQPKVLVISPVDPLCMGGGHWRPQWGTFACLLGACKFYVTCYQAARVCVCGGGGEAVEKRKCE